MDLSQIRTFVHVAHLRSITRAAEYLNISQPALTRHIQLLEQELKVKLFRRDGHGMTLTSHGLTALDHFEDILNGVDAVKRAFDPRSAQATLTGSVRIGVPVALSPLLARSFLRRCAETYPKISLQVVEGFSGLLDQWLLGDNIDLAILIGQSANSALRQTLVAVEDLAAIGSPSDDNSGVPAFTGRELLQRKLILPHKPHYVRDLIDQIGLDVSNVIEVDAMTIMLELAQMGAGYAVLPPLAAASFIAAGKLVAVPIRQPVISWTVTIAESNLRARTSETIAIRELLLSELSEAIRRGDWPARLAPALEAA